MTIFPSSLQKNESFFRSLHGFAFSIENQAIFNNTKLANIGKLLETIDKAIVFYSWVFDYSQASETKLREDNMLIAFLNVKVTCLKQLDYLGIMVGL